MKEQTKLKIGLNEGIGNEVYHEDREFASSSVLNLFIKDRYEYHKKYILGESKVPAGLQNAFDFGSYIHALVLEPHTIKDDFVHTDGKTRASKEYKKHKEENPDKIVITQTEYDKAMKMMNSFHKHEEAKGMIKDGIAESTWCTELLGKKIKVRPDYLVQGKFIVDIKTTSAPLDRESVRGKCLDYGYDVSAALYIDALKEATGVEHDFYFVFMHKSTFQVQIVKAGPNFIERGRQKYKGAITELNEIMKKGFDKPDYYGNVLIID